MCGLVYTVRPMRTDDFDYHLPESLIARRPARKREASRMLRVPRDESEAFEHLLFSDFPSLLRPGDLLVINDTKVLPARLIGHRAGSGGKVEALLIRPEDGTRWWSMVRPGKRIREGQRLVFERGTLEALVESYGEPGSGERLLAFESAQDLEYTLNHIGHTPVPPYILKARKKDNPDKAEAIEDDEDRERYQTVYAQGPGRSVAAPTAGLHFSEHLMKELADKGVEITRIQLHVGPGTFQPITTENIEDHAMHKEWIEVGPETSKAVNRAKREGRRVIAVGTTAVRTLETSALCAAGTAGKTFDGNIGERTGEETLVSLQGWTRLMISPGYDFRCVDALLTNFHLPRSSLLLLVSAFTSRERMMSAYDAAISNAYRFYSYGDCMFMD